MTEFNKRGLDVCFGVPEILDVIDNAGEAAAFLDVEFTPEFLMGVFLGIVYTTKPGKRGCSDFNLVRA